MNAVQIVMADRNAHLLPNKARKTLLHPIYRAIAKLDIAANALETEPENELRAIAALKKDIVAYIDYPIQCKWAADDLMRMTRQHITNNAIRALFEDSIDPIPHLDEMA
jgi:hypothetical protein